MENMPQANQKCQYQTANTMVNTSAQRRDEEHTAKVRRRGGAAGAGVSVAAGAAGEVCAGFSLAPCCFEDGSPAARTKSFL